MDTTFQGLINKSVAVYLDDITIYSKETSDHLLHLTQIFERCRKYGISLNPKKSVFTATKGKLLGHITSKGSIIVDPERVNSISQLAFPHNKKSM